MPFGQIANANKDCSSAEVLYFTCCKPMSQNSRSFSVSPMTLKKYCVIVYLMHVAKNLSITNFSVVNYRLIQKPCVLVCRTAFVFMRPQISHLKILLLLHLLYLAQAMSNWFLLKMMKDVSTMSTIVPMEDLDYSIVVLCVATPHLDSIVINPVLVHHPLGVTLVIVFLLGTLTRNYLMVLKLILKDAMVILFSVLYVSNSWFHLQANCPYRTHGSIINVMSTGTHADPSPNLDFDRSVDSYNLPQDAPKDNSPPDAGSENMLLSGILHCVVTLRMMLLVSTVHNVLRMPLLFLHLHSNIFSLSQSCNLH